MESLRVAAFVGSLRSSSLNRALLEHVVTVAPDGMEITEVVIRDLPLYDEDLMEGAGEEGFPAVVQRVRAQVRDADAVLFVSPEYNYSIPAPLKNAIDWISRAPDQPFAGMPVAILGASPGRLGTARMQYHLRQVCVFLDAHPINKPEVMIAGATAQLADGATPDEGTSAFIRSQLEALAAWTRQLRG